MFTTKDNKNTAYQTCRDKLVYNRLSQNVSFFENMGEKNWFLVTISKPPFTLSTSRCTSLHLSRNFVRKSLYFHPPLSLMLSFCRTLVKIVKVKTNIPWYGELRVAPIEEIRFSFLRTRIYTNNNGCLYILFFICSNRHRRCNTAQ